MWFWETNLTKDDFWEPIDCGSFMENCYMLCENDWWCNYVTTLCCVIFECCWWFYIWYIGGELLMIAYIHVLVMVRWLLFVWTYAFVVESYVHAFMTDGGGFYIQDWWWWILYPRLMVADFISNWGEYDVFVASKVTTLRCFGTTCI